MRCGARSARRRGIAGLEPRQLHVFDDPGRDDRGWVVSVAHYDVGARGADAGIRPHPDRRRRRPAVLEYDHAKIIAFAVEALRTEYRRAPDPAGLLAEPFTIRRLRQVHEGVAGELLLPDTFRRTMLAGLEATGDLFSEGRGRPAELYRRRALEPA